MSKGLEALKLLESKFRTSSWAKEIDFTMATFEIEKELKALEIIKNKRVDVSWLFSNEVNDYKDYNVWSGTENITQEEYDLLKEVL